MSLFISSLNSGSNGNCYYIGNEHDAVLIDAGISCRETEKRMERSGLEMQKVKAVFITHEHSDHTRGAEVLSKKYSLPVYISQLTHEHSWIRIHDHLTKYFTPNQTFHIGTLAVTAFPKNHDASDPFSFLVESRGVVAGVFTDIGSACHNVTGSFGRCHAAFLESNYDTAMLDTGNYPAYLKKRIKGDEGHLSNDQALDIFMNHRHPAMSHLILSHLSQENNNPDLVKALFEQHAAGVNIVVASRYFESRVYEIKA